MKAVTFDAGLLRYLFTLSAGKINKKLHYGGLSCVRLENISEPKLPGEDWVKIRTTYGGICGSDINLVFLHDTPTLSPFVSKKFVIGHENVGVIVEKGKAVKGFEVGDRVVADSILSCESRGLNKCPSCLKGDTNLCSNFSRGRLEAGTMMGTCGDTGGSWGEYYTAHSSQLFKVPDSLSDEQAVLTDPLCSAIHPVLGSLPKDNEKVLIIGMGIIGLLAVAVLRAMGSKAYISVVARHMFQGELAKKYGADHVIYSNDMSMEEEVAKVTGGRVYKPMLGEKYIIGGYDKVFDCAGSQRSIRDSVRFIRSGGTLVLVGLAANISMDWTLVWFKEINLKGTYCYGSDDFNGIRERTFRIGLDMLSSGKIDTSPLITHVFSLEDYRQAIETAAGKGKYKSIKVLLMP